MNRSVYKGHPSTPDEWWGRPEEMDEPVDIRVAMGKASFTEAWYNTGDQEEAVRVIRDYIERCEKRLAELEGR